MEVNEDQVIENNDEIVVEQEAIEITEDSEEKDPAIIQDEEEDEEDRIVTIGDEPSEEKEGESTEETPGWIKATRKSNRKLLSENKRLKREIEANKKAAEKEKPVELGVKPTLSSCNFDDKKFEQELLTYHDRKRKVEEQSAKKAKIIEDQNAEYKARQEFYAAKKQEYGFKDMEEVEGLVSDTLSETQQGIIVEGAADSALLVYALGKNPKKLDALSKMNNPITFAFEVAKLEAQLKVSSKKAPAPEKRITGAKPGALSGNTDKTLERLREEGDFTKIVAYKKKHGIK